MHGAGRSVADPNKLGILFRHACSEFMSRIPKKKTPATRRAPANAAAKAKSVLKVAATPAPTTNPAPNLGECLRAIRFRRRLSLADVSAATGLAASTLSRVETNQLSLTYDKLVQLSRGLEIDIAELLSAPDNGAAQPAMTRRSLAAPGEGKVVTVGSSAYRYLCTELSAKRMTPMVAEIHAREFAQTNGLLAHPGEEFVFVLSGTVQLLTEFYEPLTVETGACVYFDSTMRHTYLALHDTPASILCVCTSDDATIHHSLIASSALPTVLAAPGRTRSLPRKRPRSTRAAG